MSLLKLNTGVSIHSRVRQSHVPSIERLMFSDAAYAWRGSAFPFDVMRSHIGSAVLSHHIDQEITLEQDNAQRAM